LEVAAPTTTTAYYARWESNTDTSICVFTFVDVIPLPIAPDSIHVSQNVVCPGEQVLLTAVGGSVAGNGVFNWYSGLCHQTYIGSGNSISVTPSTTTTYYVSSGNLCGVSPCASKTITVYSQSIAPVSISAQKDTICAGDSVMLYVNGGSLGTGAQWCWYSQGCGTQFLGNGGSIQVSPDSNTTYFVRAESVCGITSCAEFMLNVSNLYADAGPDQTIVFGDSTILIGLAGNGSGNYSWEWSPQSLLYDPYLQNPQTISLTNYAVFTLTVTDTQTLCISDDQVVVNISGLPLIVSATANPENACLGNPVLLSAQAFNGLGSYSYIWTSDPPGFNSNLASPTAFPQYSTMYFAQAFDGANIATDSVFVQVELQPGAPIKPQGPVVVNLQLTPVTSYSVNTVAEALSYSWHLNPDSIGLMTQLDTVVNIQWVYAGDAELWCTANNTCFNTVGETLSIQIDEETMVNDKNELVQSIYPNPTSAIVTIQLEKPMEVIVRNLLGVCVDFSCKANEHKFDLSALPSGMYLVCVKNSVYKLAKK
jgi:hypothetical protein